nr:C. briggsae CBR-WRT-10 protein [Haemonchus contortus]
MLRLAVVALFCVTSSLGRRAINGTHCIKNQVITRITVFEDGTLEAECGPIPCGEVGRRCIHDQTSCRADTDVFSGMRWAPNGQSVLLRCCTIKVPNKIYVGTDLVTAGSYYEGGVIAKKDMYYPKGREYDFIANVRTEQGGVRVWVYRIACGENDRRVDFEPIGVAQPQPHVEKPSVQLNEERPRVQNEMEANRDGDETEDEEEDEEGDENEEATEPPQTFNPLRYRPPNVRGTRKHA